MKIRLLVILYFFEGYASLKVAKLVHKSDSTIRRYLLERCETKAFKGVELDNIWLNTDKISPLLSQHI